MSTRNEERLGMSAASLRKLFSYDPESGRIYWRVDRFTGGAKSRRKIISAGDEAGSTTTSGYRVICINYCRIYSHRLAWCLTKGTWPSGILDHIDLDRSNNRMSNLRPATEGQNRANSPARNEFGLKGVIRPKGTHRFAAQISVDGKNKYLGMHDTPEDAHDTYMRAAKAAFGEFARN